MVTRCPNGRNCGGGGGGDSGDDGGVGGGGCGGGGGRAGGVVIKLGGPVGAPSRHLHGFGAFFANVSRVLRFWGGIVAFVRVSVRPSVRAPHPRARPKNEKSVNRHYRTR